MASVGGLLALLLLSRGTLGLPSLPVFWGNRFPISTPSVPEDEEEHQQLAIPSCQDTSSLLTTGQGMLRLPGHHPVGVASAPRR